MKTLRQWAKAQQSFHLWTDTSDPFLGWIVAPCGTNRDADAMTRANWKAQADHFAESERHEAEFSHWAVGWTKLLLVKPTANNRQVIREIAAELDDYPVLDEDAWVEMEQDDANLIWSDCLSPKERIKYIREYRIEFDFASLSDLLGCIRGLWFGGDAGHLTSC